MKKREIYELAYVDAAQRCGASVFDIQRFRSEIAEGKHDRRMKCSD